MEDYLIIISSSGAIENSEVSSTNTYKSIFKHEIYTSVGTYMSYIILKFIIIYYIDFFL